MFRRMGMARQLHETDARQLFKKFVMATMRTVRCQELERKDQGEYSFEWALLASEDFL